MTGGRLCLVDNLTHTLFAATLANAGLRRAGRGVTATLLIASNIPDIEIFTTFTGGRVAYLSAHRGATHGPGALLLAAGTAGLVWGFQRLRAARGSHAMVGSWQPRAAEIIDSPLDAADERAPAAAFLALLLAACLGVAGHVAMDFATSYGTRVLSPFTGMWFGVDCMPIIDLFLLALLAGGLIVPRLWAAHMPAGSADRLRARVAIVVLLLGAADYAGRAALHARAIERAVELQRSLPGVSPTVATPPAVFRYLGRVRPAALPAALPTEGSPFSWRLVVAARGGYLVTQVNLRDRDSEWMHRAAANAVWFPDDTGPFVDRAAAAAMGRVFLNFSRFPAAEILTHTNGDLTVHWYDLRFAEHRAPVGNDRRRHTSPFGAWVRLSPDGLVLAQGLGPG